MKRMDTAPSSAERAPSESADDTPAPRRSIVVISVIVLFVVSTPTPLEIVERSAAALGIVFVLFLIVAGANFNLLRSRPYLLWSLAVVWLLATSLMRHDSIGLTRSLLGVLMFALTVVLALCVAQTATLREFRSAVAWFGVLVTVGSFMIAVIAPSWGLVVDAKEAGALRGLYIHRNILAFVLVATLAAQLYSIKSSRGIAKLGWLLAVTLSSIGVVMTRSSTALIVAVFLIGAIVTIAILRRSQNALRGAFAMILLIASGLSISLMLDNIDSFTAAVGRDVTFSGRTKIWEAVWSLILEDPIFGHGWTNVWGSSSELGIMIRNVVGFDEATHAHNGYLDLWLQGGFVFLLLFAIAIFVSLLRLYRLLPIEQDANWLLATLLVLLISNMTESRFARMLGVFLLVATWYYAFSLTQRQRDALRPPDISGHRGTHTTYRPRSSLNFS